MLTLRKFKLVELAGFRYWKGTFQMFGFMAALTQLSPLVNTLRYGL